MKKFSKILLSFIFILISGFVVTFNVEAATSVKETSDDFTGDVYIIGSTKFDNNTIITASRAAQAGSNETIIQMYFIGNYQEIDLKTYYYNELEESWFLVPEDGEEELVALTEEETEELEENLTIYFVNNEEKVLEFAYDGDVNSESVDSPESMTGLKATYRDGKFYIPITAIEIYFEDSNGEEKTITTVYDYEEDTMDLGNFFVPITVKVLDENGQLIPDLSVSANIDGYIDYTGDLFNYNKYGYELYYVDEDGEKVDFETFKVTKGTTIKQAWKPVGDIHSNDSTLENYILTHSGVIYKTEAGISFPLWVNAPEGYDTTNTKINDRPVVFEDGCYQLDVLVPAVGEKKSIKIEWAPGEEVTYSVVVSEDAKYSYKYEYYNDAEEPLMLEYGEVMEGESLIKPDYVFEKDDMVFVGWTLDKATNTLFDFSQGVNDNLKLYPVFITVKEFIENSSAEEPAKLLSNLRVTQNVVIDKDADMVLDLNGYTISSRDVSALRLKGNNSSLIIKNGTFDIYGSGAYAVAIGANKEDATGVTKRNLIIEEDVVINSEAYGLVVFGKSQLDFNGTINVSGDGYGISGNGNANNEGTVINIHDKANITAENGAAIYLPQAGTTNIEGGRLSANTVIGIKAGNLNITGGTFTATGALAAPAPNGNGFDLTGDIILVEENASYADHVVIDITGGTFDNANGGAIVREFNPSIGTANERTVTVKGKYATRVLTDVANIFEYVATDLATLELNGVKYTTKELTYALEASDAENEVSILKDITLTDTILVDADKDMYLNLNGNNISISDVHAIRLKGNASSLTIRNGSFTTTGAGAAVAIGTNKEDATGVTKRNLIIEEDVTINAETYGLVVFGKSELDFNGTIVVSGDGYGISGNGNANNEGTVINIHDKASITAENGAAIYLPQAGTTNIEGGRLSANTVIGIKAGNLNITGGTFTSTGSLAAPAPNGNGFDLTGDIILVEENASYADHVVIDITGGTFDNANGGAVVREFNPSIGTANERAVTVKGKYATRKATEDPYIFVYEQ